jgi:tRNA threonylcarbamoyl adenosine modification protein (Sua5/YciO/YrdC/YwlC family)
MAPTVLEASDPEAVDRVIGLLRGGAVVAVPTDTVYGLAVDPGQADAVERVFALKERPAEVALPVLVGSAGQVEEVAEPLEPAARGLAERFWPGPLTLVVPRRRGFDVDLGGGPRGRWTVGVRWPDHPVVRALCLAVGPLAVTSANSHGKPPATTAAEVATAFADDGSLAAVLDGGPCAGLPSTVVECRGPASRCLREGRIPWDEIGRG